MLLALGYFSRTGDATTIRKERGLAAFIRVAPPAAPGRETCYFFLSRSAWIAAAIESNTAMACRNGIAAVMKLMTALPALQPAQTLVLMYAYM